MSEEGKEKIMKLLKSGNFTIAGHDSGEYELYEGHHDYDDLPEDSVAGFSDWDRSNGYIPDLLALLVECLGGKTDSI